MKIDRSIWPGEYINTFWDDEESKVDIVENFKLLRYQFGRRLNMKEFFFQLTLSLHAMVCGPFWWYKIPDAYDGYIGVDLMREMTID